LRSRPERLIASALLLLASSCTDDKRAAELACQQRLADVPRNLKMEKTGARETIFASRFAQLSAGYAQMPLDGCTEHQAHTAKSLAKLAGELADKGTDALRTYESAPSMKDNRFLEVFMIQLKQFENRRHVVLKNLERMKGEEAAVAGH
jgi:hypothetical protein